VESAYLGRFVYAAPAVAYKLSKTLSVGLSVGLSEAVEGLKISLREPNDVFVVIKEIAKLTEFEEGVETLPIFTELFAWPTPPLPFFGGGIGPYDPIGSLSFDVSDNLTTSFNVGLLWEPWAWFSAGIVYQSKSKAEMGGKYSFKYSQDWQNVTGWFASTVLGSIEAASITLPVGAVPEQKGRAIVRFTFPQRAQLGIMLRPMKRLRLLCDLHWTDWSAWDEDRIEFDQDIQVLAMATFFGYKGGRNAIVQEHHWEDTYHASYGLEWQPFDWVSLRLGYEPKRIEKPVEFFTLTTPLTNIDIYSAGLGLNLSKSMSLDLGFAYMESEKLRIEDKTSVNLNNLTYMFYSPYYGLHYEQDEIKAQVYSLNFTYRW
jgi:long-subunit fatty acid transport protein